MSQSCGVLSTLNNVSNVYVGMRNRSLNMKPVWKVIHHSLDIGEDRPS